jgi:hypothetical protein
MCDNQFVRLETQIYSSIVQQGLIEKVLHYKWHWQAPVIYSGPAGIYPSG